MIESEVASKIITFEDLVEYVKNHEPTEEDIRKFEDRIIELEKRFAEEVRRQRIDQEWLNREYTI